MKILKLILSQLLVIFKLVPEATRKAIVIHILTETSKNTTNKVDDAVVKYVDEAWK